MSGELPGARSRALLVDEPTTGLDAFQAPAGRRMWQSMAGVPAFRFYDRRLSAYAKTPERGLPLTCRCDSPR